MHRTTLQVEDDETPTWTDKMDVVSPEISLLYQDAHAVVVSAQLEGFFFYSQLRCLL